MIRFRDVIGGIRRGCWRRLFGAFLVVHLGCWGAATDVFRDARWYTVKVVNAERLSTGVAISPDGLILTNLDVAGALLPITVVRYRRLPDGQKTRAGKSYEIERITGGEVQVVAVDRIHGMAIIQVARKDLVVAPLAAGAPASGSTCFAVGYRNDATSEIKGPELYEGIVASRGAYRSRPHAMGMTCVVNEGMAGGPVLDETGRLIGISTIAKGYLSPDEDNAVAIDCLFADGWGTLLMRAENRIRADFHFELGAHYKRRTGSAFFAGVFAAWHFQKSLESDPRNVAGYLSLASAYQAQGEYANAQIYYDLVESLQPCATARLFHADMAKRRRDLEKAEHWYRQALSVEPKWQDPQVMTLAARALADLQRVRPGANPAEIAYLLSWAAETAVPGGGADHQNRFFAKQYTAKINDAQQRYLEGKQTGFSFSDLEEFKTLEALPADWQAEATVDPPAFGYPKYQVTDADRTRFDATFASIRVMIGKLPRQTVLSEGGGTRAFSGAAPLVVALTDGITATTGLALPGKRVLTHASIGATGLPVLAVVPGSSTAHELKLVAAHPERDLVVYAADEELVGKTPIFVDKASVGASCYLLSGASVGRPADVVKIRQGIVSGGMRQTEYAKSALLQTTFNVNANDVGAVVVAADGGIIGIADCSPATTEDVGYVIPVDEKILSELVPTEEMTAGRVVPDLSQRYLVEVWALYDSILQDESTLALQAAGLRQVVDVARRILMHGGGNPQHVIQAIYLLANVCIRYSRNDVAVTLFERLCKLEPSRSAYRGELARAVLMTGDEARARQYFVEALAMPLDPFYPNRADAAFYGDLLYQNREYAKAAYCYRWHEAVGVGNNYVIDTASQRLKAILPTLSERQQAFLRSKFRLFGLAEADAFALDEESLVPSGFSSIAEVETVPVKWRELSVDGGIDTLLGRGRFLVAVSSDRQALTVIDLQTDGMRQIKLGEGDVWSLAGAFLYWFKAASGTFCKMDAESGRILKEIKLPPWGRMTAIAASAGGLGVRGLATIGLAVPPKDGRALSAFSYINPRVFSFDQDSLRLLPLEASCELGSHLKNVALVVDETGAASLFDGQHRRVCISPDPKRKGYYRFDGYMPKNQGTSGADAERYFDFHTNVYRRDGLPHAIAKDHRIVPTEAVSRGVVYYEDSQRIRQDRRKGAKPIERIRRIGFWGYNMGRIDLLTMLPDKNFRPNQFSGWWQGRTIVCASSSGIYCGTFQEAK